MSDKDKKVDQDRIVDDCFSKGPQSEIEKTLLEEFLHQRDLTLADLRAMPKDQADVLLAAACQYASLKMAQMESAAHMKESFRYGH